MIYGTDCLKIYHIYIYIDLMYIYMWLRNIKTPAPSTRSENPPDAVKKELPSKRPKRKSADGSKGKRKHSEADETEPVESGSKASGASTEKKTPKEKKKASKVEKPKASKKAAKK